jgi:hypothetical protein
MKKNDLTLIAVVIIFSSVFAVIISSLLFTGPDEQQQTVEKVQAITSEFNEPNDEYFNNESINPTKLIRIGDGESNESPFIQSDN